jgi:aerobic-type carbon monoxide dehydrogenase small subunit (CoxS/CutS family)
MEPRNGGAPAAGAREAKTPRRAQDPKRQERAPQAENVRAQHQKEASTSMSAITLRVNGRSHTVDIDPATPLLYVLADDLALRGPKFGCGLGQCGSCTAIVGGRAVRTCVTPVGSVGTAEVVTLEGLGTQDRPHPIQQAFIDEQAAQCGFCLSGVILTAKAALDQNPKATDVELQEAMSTVLCRCFTHARMWKAIKRYAAEKA